MQIRDALLPEFDQESANTRKVLERVPMDKADWRPHPKSWDMATLADHLQGILQWAVAILTCDSFDVASPEAEQFRPDPARTREELAGEIRPELRRRAGRSGRRRAIKIL